MLYNGTGTVSCRNDHPSARDTDSRSDSCKTHQTAAYNQNAVQWDSDSDSDESEDDEEDLKVH